VRLDDPALVRAEYASEDRLVARKNAYRLAEGPDARQTAFEAIAEVSPRRVLEVGCDEGELAERIATELGCEVVAVDQSERMVALADERGVDARAGNVGKLPSTIAFGGRELPAFEGPLRARRAPVVFVADLA
jgi:2-polyprenyl-3-methyl-5-hydroxy-6-metoxy-1,4-benzoquinol methylase